MTPTTSDLQFSSTVVMVELEPKAALKSFKPTSVTFGSPVCERQKSLVPSPTHTWVHSYEHSGNRSGLPFSLTVVMVELEPKAALKSFKPASVTW